MPYLTLSIGLLTAVAVFAFTRHNGAEPVRLDPVAKAAETTSAVSSFRFSFTASIALGGASSGTLGVNGSGAYDGEGRRMEMSFDYALPPELRSRLPGGASGELIADTSNGFVMYMSFPFLASHLPAGKTWLKLDLGRYAKSMGVDRAQLMQTSQGDPSQIL